MKYLIDSFEITIDGLEILYYLPQWTESKIMLIKWNEIETFLPIIGITDELRNDYYSMYEDDGAKVVALDTEKFTSNLDGYDVERLFKLKMSTISLIDRFPEPVKERLIGISKLYDMYEPLDTRRFIYRMMINPDLYGGVVV